MAHGADPNVGRILMAIGKCSGVRIVNDSVLASINGIPVVENGMRAGFEDARVRETLSGDTVDLEVDLGAGTAEAMAYGCDLTAGYVEENAAYYSS
jgi:glutamate N-acetyltransferase/amino-acid N-acetyltransferase